MSEPGYGWVAAYAETLRVMLRSLAAEVLGSGQAPVPVAADFVAEFQSNLPLLNAFVERYKSSDLVQIAAALWAGEGVLPVLWTERMVLAWAEVVRLANEPPPADEKPRIWTGEVHLTNGESTGDVVADEQFLTLRVTKNGAERVTVRFAQEMLAGKASVELVEGNFLRAMQLLIGVLKADEQDEEPDQEALRICRGCELSYESCEKLWADQRKCCPDCSHGCEPALAGMWYGLTSRHPGASPAVLAGEIVKMVGMDRARILADADFEEHETAFPEGERARVREVWLALKTRTSPTSH